MNKIKLFLPLLISLIGFSSVFSQVLNVTATKKDACSGSGNGSITITVLNTTTTAPPYSYFIFGITNGSGPFVGSLALGVPVTVPNLPVDNYLVNVIDNSPLVANFNTFLAINDVSPGISASVTTKQDNLDPTCVAPNGFINISVAGGSGSYNFSWTASNGFTSASQNISGLAGGTYNLTITDSNVNCSFLLPPVTLTDLLPTAYNISTTTPSICAGSTYVIKLSGSDAGVTYTVLVNGIATATTAIGTGLPLTINYNGPPALANGDAITVKAALGLCTPVIMNNTLIANINPPPTSATLSALGLTTICAGNSTTLKVVVVGGTPNFGFPITNGPTQANYVSGSAISVSPLVTTTYDLTGNTVTDSKGCTVSGTGSVTITVTPAPIATISASPTLVCPGSTSTLTFTLTGTAPFNVTYTDGVTPVTLVGIVNGHTVNVTPASTTTYTITSVTDATTCSGAAGSNTTVTVNPPPTSATLSALGLTTICAGNSTTLKVVVVGGTPNFGFPITNGPTQANYVSGSAISVSPLVTTTYDLTGNTVTDSKGCTVSGTGSVTITVTPAPIATISASPTLVCPGSTSTLTFTLTGTAPFNVTYTDGVTPVTLVGIVNGHTVNVTPASTTTYTITSVTDGTGCSGAAGSNTTVSVNAPPTSAVLSGDNTVCSGTPADLSVAITGGVGPYSFTINNGVGLVSGYVSGNPIPVTPPSTTSYSIVGNVTDANGCTVAGSGGATVTVNIAATPSLNGPATSCLGASSINYTSDTGMSSYTWNVSAGGTISANNSDNVNIDWNAAGPQTVSVSYTDLNGCVTAPTVLNVNVADLTVTPTITNNTRCIAPYNGAISLAITGATGPLTFSWTSSLGFVSSVQDISNLAPDSYNITVTDANSGCTVSLSVLTVDDNSPTISLNLSSNTDNDRCITPFDGSLNITTAGSLGSPTFSWSGPAGFTSTNQNISNLNSGNYDITVTDPVSGCTALQTFVVNDITPTLNLSTNAVDNTNCASPFNGSITLTVSGGGPNYSYQWTGPSGFTAITQNISALASGSYDVTVTDLASGCSAILTGTVINDNFTPITGDVSGTAIVCAGQSTNLTFTLTGAGPTYDVTYTDGSSNFIAAGITSGGTFSVTPASSLSYTIVSVKDNGSGCVLSAPDPSITGSADMTVNPSPVGSISGSTVICNGQNATLTFTLSAGTFDVVYTDGATNFTLTGISTGATASVSPSVSTTYSIVSIQDNASSCIVTSPNANITGSAVVTVNPIPAGSISGPANLCLGQTATLTFTLSAGTFDVVYTDGVSNFTLSGISSGATASVSPASNTTYTIVSITDNASACSVIAPNASITGSVAINVVSVNVTLVSTVNATCLGLNDGITQVNGVSGGSAPYQYSIDNGVTFQLSNTFSSVAPGNYQVVAKDQNGCISTASSTTVGAGTIITPSTSFIDATCLGATNGSITVTSVAGGVAPYTYSDDNGATFQASNNFAGLGVGSYQIVTKDNNGCQSAAATVAVGSSITITFTATPTNASCVGINDGQINITSPTGGTGPYTYSNDNGATFQASPSFTNLATATYNVVLQDANGCLSSSTATVVGSNTTITFTTSNIDASCAGANNGSITVTTVAGGTPAYSYSSDGGVTFQASNALNNLAANTYSVVVKDNGGCLSSPVSVTINNLVSIVPTFTETDATCAANDGSIVVNSVTGGTIPYNYSIDNGITFQASTSFAGLIVATYMLVVKDNNGCLSTPASIIVNKPGGCGGLNCGAFTIVASDTRPTCSGQNDGTITISVSGGTPNYITTLFDLSSGFSQALAGSGLFAFVNLSPSLTYQYTIQDASGNTCTLPYSLPLQTTIQAIASGLVNASCFGQGGQATLTVTSGGIPPYEYSADGGTTWVSFTSPVTISNLPTSPSPYAILVRNNPADLCPTGVPVTINGPAASLDTLYVKKKISLPNLPTGSALIGIKQSMVPPYQLMLQLITPFLPGQKNLNAFDSLWVNVPFNNQDLQYELDVTVLYPGDYRLSIRDSLGCTKTYDVNLNTTTGLFIPNIFTPNNDGKNDVFEILNLPTSAPNEATIVITNRWGKQVYQNDSYGYNNNWWNGGSESDGIYFYRLNAGGKSYTGWVEILHPSY